MSEYIRYDFINEEYCEYYGSLQDLLIRTNEFYHETFSMENEEGECEGYDENKEYKTLNEAVELWEGSGFGIARVLKGKV